MAAEQAINYKDLLLVLRRRPLFVLLFTSLLTAGAGFLILNLPDVYVARSVLFLDQGRLPKGFQQAGVIVPPLDQLIGRLRQEVLSREVLREIVNELSLYEQGEMSPQERDRLFARGPKGWLEFMLYQDPLDRARDDIRIEIVKRNGQEFIEVSAEARTAELAAGAVNRTSDILASKNGELRIRKGEEVDSFLADQLAKARTQLDEEEEKLKRFRAEHQETLPENAEALNNRLSELKTRIETRVQQIRTSESTRAMMEFRIAARLKQAARDYRPEEPTAIHRERTPEEIELEHLLKQDEEMALTYKPNHPARKLIAGKIQILQERVREILAEIDGSLVPEEEPAPEAAATPAESPPQDGRGPVGGPEDEEPPIAGVEPGSPDEKEDAKRSIGIWDGRIDQEKIVERLVELNASQELLEDVQGLISRIAGLSVEIDELARQQEKELREIDRHEMLRAQLAPTRIQLGKIEKNHEDTLQTHREIEGDWQSIQKFLAAERAMRGDQLRVIEAAEAPLLPAAPNRPLLGLGALLASLLVSLLLGALFEKGKRTYMSASEVEEDLGIPVLATLPAVLALEDQNDDDRAFLSTRNRTLKWLGREQLHRLRCAIGNTPRNGEVRSILVTSTVESEGKTLVATGLAHTIARSLDHWALLVETDLRRPAIAERFRLEPGPGLSEHIVDGLDLSRSIRPAGVPKFSVLCAGESADAVGAAHVIDSAPMQRLAVEVRNRYPDRFVIYDAPPVLPTPDPLSLSRLVDGIVFVICAGKTPRKLVKRALAALPSDKILGVVLNQVVFDRKELRYLSSYYASDRTLEADEPGKALEESSVQGGIDYDAPTETIRRPLPGAVVREPVPSGTGSTKLGPRLKPLAEETDPPIDDDEPGEEGEPPSPRLGRPRP